MDFVNLELKTKSVKLRNSTVFRFDFSVFSFLTGCQLPEKELSYEKEKDIQA